MTRSDFLKLVAKRLFVFTLVVALLFMASYVLDRTIEYGSYATYHTDGSVSYHAYTMFIPLGALAILFAFLWLIGAVVVVWVCWNQYERLQSGGALLQVSSKAQLQKIILRRYQKSFLSSVGLFTLVLGLVAAMMFLIQKSRTWYADEPFYLPLKLLKEISPFAGIALWVGGVALVLYRQWRQSASDVVGLIGSIEQMQAEQKNGTITVPDTLPEVQPIVQGIYDEAQRDKRMAQEAEQRKNELIAYLAHDLKTPLTSIIGYLSLLVEQPDMPVRQKAEYSRIALDKAIRLENLIGQFFEISRYNLNEMVLDRERLDLKYLLIQLADEFYPILEPQGKSIALDAPDDLWVNGDAGKLARVFNNIIRNAVAYGYPDSPIQITATRQDAHVAVTIANRGRDIPEHQLQNIFNKFFRLDDARNSDTGGAGLGLAIAQEIVALHGGSITAHSAGETVVFTVLLPVQEGLAPH